jgi:VanZ family protein
MGKGMPNPKMGRAGRFGILATLWALIIFVLSSIPGTAFPTYSVLTFDKLIHAAVYAVLGALCFLALPRKWSPKTGVLVLIAGAIATVYGASDEFHQVFVPGRFSDPRDVLADGVGGFVGALIASTVVAARAGPAAGQQGPSAK